MPGKEAEGRHVAAGASIRITRLAEGTAVPRLRCASELYRIYEPFSFDGTEHVLWELSDDGPAKGCLWESLVPKKRRGLIL